MPTPETRLWRLLTRWDIDVFRFAASLSDRQVAVLAEIAEDIRAEIARADMNAPSRQGDRLNRLAKLEVALGKIIDAAYTKITRQTFRELDEFAETALTQTFLAINTALRADIATLRISENLIEALTKESLIDGKFTPKWYADLKGRHKDLLRRQLRLGNLSGDGIDAMVARMELLSHKTGREIETLARSSVLTVNNAASMEVFKQNADILDGVQQVSTLDKRTSLICIALDQLRWTMDGTPIGHDKAFNGGPPHHFNCRSRLVPYFDRESSKIKNLREARFGDRGTPGTRIEGDTSFARFLRDLGENGSIDLLGRTRYQLWQDGKISLTDLIDRSGNIRTVGDLT